MGNKQNKKKSNKEKDKIDAPIEETDEIIKKVNVNINIILYLLENLVLVQKRV